MKHIPLTQGKFAIVDEEDYVALVRFKWHFGGHHGYALRKIRVNGRQKIIWMHREVLNTPDGVMTDHINGNKIDNRRCNLRQATPSQNRQNQRKPTGSTSLFKGVWKERGKWRSSIKPMGQKRIRLGIFNSEEDAAKAYDRMARSLFGSFAATNFPE